MVETFIFLSYVLGTYMGFVFARAKVNKIIEETIDNLIHQGFLKTKKSHKGEIEIMKWKFLLIATAMNLQLLYPSETVCNQALEKLKEQDPKAICIPAGQPVDEVDRFFQSFFDMIIKLDEKNQNILTK